MIPLRLGLGGLNHIALAILYAASAAISMSGSGRSGKHLLDQSITGFDPKRKSKKQSLKRTALSAYDYRIRGTARRMTSACRALKSLRPVLKTYFWRKRMSAKEEGKVHRIGVLVNRGHGEELNSLRAGMSQLGYVDGSNIVYEPRFPEGRLDRLPGFAAELVSGGVDVIVTYGGPPTNAARKATTTIPIVFALVADPVAIGVASTLARPGGNLTGVTNLDPELAGRQMALLKEVVPNLARVAIFGDADIPGADATGLAPVERRNVAAARAAGLLPQVLKLRGPEPDLDGAFKAMSREGADALVVLEVPAYYWIPGTVATMATARRLPSMFWGGQSDAGGLMSYGTSFKSTFDLVPKCVDRVLKGAKPAEMAIEVVSKRELAINLKTARELGVTIPAELLKRADHIIE
jgi:putative ABC transport system substrate-binding protein